MATKTTMQAEPTLKQLASKVRITCDYGARLGYDKQDEWQRKSNGYRCRLSYQGRSYTFDFWQGSLIKGEPTAQGCLECLLSDAQSGDQDFESFCSELGYDLDSRKAEKTWKACQRSSKSIKRLLGADYETFLYADRD